MEGLHFGDRVTCSQRPTPNARLTVDLFCMVFMGVVLTERCDAQVGGGGALCTYQQHWNQIPPYYRQCVVGDPLIAYDVIDDEEIDEVVNVDSLEHYLDVPAVCEVKPCGWTDGPHSHTYQEEEIKSDSVEGSQSTTAKAQLAITLVGEVGIEHQFVITGQFSRTTTITTTDAWNYYIDTCMDKRYELWRGNLSVQGWRYYIAQQYTWNISGSPCYSSAPFTTECGDAIIEGEAGHGAGFTVLYSDESCCVEPGCCGAPCGP